MGFVNCHTVKISKKIDSKKFEDNWKRGMLPNLSLTSIPLSGYTKVNRYDCLLCPEYPCVDVVAEAL